MENHDDIASLQAQAAAAFDAGNLGEAARLYARLVALRPDGSAFHFRLGLAQKYLRDWPASLEHNLRSLALDGEHDEAASWNAGIAATALGDWPEARRQWQACGIELEPGAGPVEENFGPIGLRLNPWDGGETVFALRIDPARAMITNVPLPGSGHRFNDLVLHDGAQTGERHYFDHTVPVFNALARLEPSNFITFTAFLGCDSAGELEALLEFDAPGVGQVEDWTSAIRSQCLRCSYGVPHAHARHDPGDPTDWNPDRTLGIAAESDVAVRGLLAAWAAGDPARRRVDAIECREAAAPEPGATGSTWWRAPART